MSFIWRQGRNYMVNLFNRKRVRERVKAIYLRNKSDKVKMHCGWPWDSHPILIGVQKNISFFTVTGDNTTINSLKLSNSISFVLLSYQGKIVFSSPNLAHFMVHLFFQYCCLWCTSVALCLLRIFWKFLSKVLKDLWFSKPSIKLITRFQCWIRMFNREWIEPNLSSTHARL